MNAGSTSRISNVIGFDDAPFTPEYTGPVKMVGTVYARQRLTGVLIGDVLKDGDDAAQALGCLIAGSKFAGNLHLVMLQGIALGGFNVVDVFALHAHLDLPILVVSCREPDMDAIRDALLTQIPNSARKWAIIERLGPMESLRHVYAQRVGLTTSQADAVLKQIHR